ncbi:Glucose oxidase [Madurella fahalii]|uniref:Glucose oxidase n=1 Tax=Madurella fahalii TaxID=1157608 RepID=A0ABQ0GGC7_9PEZI
MGRLTLTLALAYSIGKPTAAIEDFDYIIVGAGTTGLVVANRLSEDPSVTVAVIEPGTDQRDNINVTATDRFSQAFNTPIDWAYETVMQPGAGNRSLPLHQGKAWGGTSTINGMTYIRGNIAEIDSWEHLGNPGWNWGALLPYYKLSEGYTIPTDTQLAAGATYRRQYHGFDGPLRVGYSAALRNGSFAPAVMQTWEGLSLSQNPDLNSGDVRGFSMGPQTLDPGNDVRWDAARAYYHPVEHRHNLRILKGTVRRITWADGKRYKRGYPSARLVASGIEMLTDDGKLTKVRVRNEVVISAGAVRTPLVLEASGIGNPSVLRALDIETRVNLPGVGENLVEQPSHLLRFSGNLEPSANAYHTFVTAADVFGADLAAVEEETRNSLSRWAQAAVDASKPGSLKASAVAKLLRIQHEILFKRNGTIGEVLTIVAPGGVLASQYWLLLPFSRGSAHLGSLDDIDEPVIDPRIFLADFDLAALTAVGRLAETFWRSDPMNVRASVVGPIPQGTTSLPNNATDAEWHAHLRDTVAANSHVMGTASMMSRELGGVVDPELRVYGTVNVRVVDASILPTQISGHLTATLYAVAERASEIIKGTCKK